MERGIKFRAWSKQDKCFLPITPYEWIDGVYVGTTIPQRQALNTFEVSETECNRKTGKSMFLTLDGTIVNIHPVSQDITQSLDLSERYEILQYTGLKDKNGKEIYEGDIIQWLRKQSYHTYWKGDKCPVQWFDDGQFTGFGFTKDKPLTSKKAEELKVIGNVYENPELVQ